MQIPKQPWSLSASEAVSLLETSLKGLSFSVAQKRLAEFGDNTFHNKEKKSAVSIFLKQFKSPLIFLLVGASILTIVLHEWIDTAVILFAVLLNVILGFYHEYGAESTLEKLKTFIKDRAKVVRDGREQEVDSSTIVPGDIIKLSYGSRVPADARIINENNLRIDEAILTGESMPIEKGDAPVPLTAIIAEQKNITHAGTLVVEGYASAVVFATGNSTEIGKIAGIVSKIERVETPLQRGVGKLAWLIFFVVLIIVLGILILGISRGGDLIPMLLLSGAVAVGAVPEALPIALTVILAIGAKKIADKKGIIRKLTAAETLGSATIVLTDKTGTLPLADMQLVGIHGTGALVSESKESTKNLPQTFSSEQKKLLELALLNVDIYIENQNEEMKNWTFKGRPFEVNIAKSGLLHGVSLDGISGDTSSLILPFNSSNKFSIAQVGNKYIAMGAPEILLKKSKIGKEDYLKIESWIEKTSREGKRLIGLGSFPKETKGENEHFDLAQVKNLEFLGVLTFYDPIRPEVPEAIKNIQSHEMKVVLVTGDLAGTAVSVASGLGWEATDEEVVTGGELRVLTDDELTALVPKIKIFARVTPEDKLRIGQAYQRLGEVVAMTGDGVNDAPVLKAMDIGISLGSGSDVAKSAADLVLLDDNFQTISLAIDEGRKILSNIRKSFVYLMSNSLDEVFVIGGSLLFALPFPLTALQIIWVNLFTGSLPALAFAFDDDIDKGMNKKSSKQELLNTEVKILSFGLGTISSILIFLLYYILLYFKVEIGIARSIFFVCFSLYILVIAFSFRSLHRPLFSYNPFLNKKLNLAVGVGLGILVATMSIPFMRDLFKIAPMPMSWMWLVIFWGLLNILLVELAKWIFRHRMIVKVAKEKR